MPSIRPISDLRNNSNEISEFVKGTREPVFITKNGVGDMVVLSMETFEAMQAQVELYSKLGEAEARVAEGERATDFKKFAAELRGRVHGKI